MIRVAKIRTDYWAKPIPLRQFDWSAVDDDTYDGAPDSSNCNMVGYGMTEEEAVADLLRLMSEMDPQEYGGEEAA